MRSVHSLIDEASEKCGSDAKLARALSVAGHHPNEWRSGVRPVSPMTVGLLCDVLELDGEEARRLGALAIIATAKPEKRGVLRRSFFGLLDSGAGSGEAERPQMLCPNDALKLIDDEGTGAKRVTSYTLSWIAGLERRMRSAFECEQWFHAGGACCLRAS